MTKESTILLMKSKLNAFKNGLERAKAQGDVEAAAKWREGCRNTQARLKQLLDEQE